jgi:hypothetical protein
MVWSTGLLRHPCPHPCQTGSDDFKTGVSFSNELGDDTFWEGIMHLGHDVHRVLENDAFGPRCSQGLGECNDIMLRVGHDLKLYSYSVVSLSSHNLSYGNAGPSSICHHKQDINIYKGP